MFELYLVDLIILKCISEWNQREAARVLEYPKAAAAAKPLTAGKLKLEAVRFCIENNIPKQRSVDQENEIYRIAPRLIAPGLIHFEGSRFYQTERGDALLNMLPKNAKTWPLRIEYNGDKYVVKDK